MTDQQNEITLQMIKLQDLSETSQSSFINQQKNQDNESKASSDKGSKKSDKTAALETGFNSKMRLRIVEYETIQKKQQMKMLCFVEEGAFKLEYERKHLTQETLVLIMLPRLV